jgi:hypothetical protein
MVACSYRSQDRLFSSYKWHYVFVWHLSYVFIKSIEKLPNSSWILVFQLTHAFCNLSRMNSECYLNLYLLLPASGIWLPIILDHPNNTRGNTRRIHFCVPEQNSRFQKHELKHDKIDHQNPKQGIWKWHHDALANKISSLAYWVSAILKLW